MRTIFLTSILLLIPISGAIGVATSNLCKEFRELGWPDNDQLLRYSLTPTFERGAKQYATDNFYNLDIDNDDIGDVIKVSCSASSMPSDPCALVVKLSSGGRVDFEAWHLFLVRHNGHIYAITENDNGSGNEIYRVGEQNINLVCTTP